MTEKVLFVNFWLNRQLVALVTINCLLVTFIVGA
jgi:hypothetical protein